MSNEISINQEQANFLVYKHTNKINGKVYIGITHYKDPNKRWKNGKGYKNNSHFWSAIQKYGWDNFDHEIIQENLSKLDAEILEEKLIAEYNATNQENGYNSLLSSINSHNHFTKEDRIMMSNNLLNRYKNGFIHPMLGKHHSQESIEKMKQSHIGKKASESTKNKLSILRKGVSKSQHQKDSLKKTRQDLSKRYKLYKSNGEYTGKWNDFPKWEKEKSGVSTPL